MYISEETLDDLMRSALSIIIDKGTRITATKGSSLELTGVLLELTNPRARLSRTETKGTLFSCLGEFFWYLSGDNSLEFIKYYIPIYEKFSDNGKTLHGAYGPRLFNLWSHHNQVENIINLLKKKPTSRQAVIQMFDSSDISIVTKDVPCTSTIQFLIRNSRLDMIINMRSNDAFLGLPHDIFAFTMLQELVAGSLGLEVGSYKHFVGSLHLYDDKLEEAKLYLNEGWQSSISMPVMPTEEQFKIIPILLSTEEKIRQNTSIDLQKLELPNYWLDIFRLLQIFSISKMTGVEAKLINNIEKQMISKSYLPYIQKRVELNEKKTLPALSILLKRMETPLLSSTNIISWSCPVPSFGDLFNSEVATLGLNPSNREFVDTSEVELDGDLRRFHTLKSLKIKKWSNVNSIHQEMILDSCINYFNNNPYDGWFKSLDYLLHDTNYSYYNSSRKACHLDLVPYATFKKWTDLTSSECKHLLSSTGDILAMLITDSPIKILILNGITVVKSLELISNVKLNKTEMPNWNLPRKSGKDVKGYAFKGYIKELSGIKLEREVLVLGFNHNIQSSFGVTTKVKDSIKTWIGISTSSELNEN